MAIENRHLAKDLISNPEHYRMILRIGPGRTDAAVLSARIAGSLLLSGERTDGDLRRLEDFVYDNPLLLLPFAKTDIVVETAGYSLIPSGTSEELYPSLLRTALGEEMPESEPVLNPLPGTGISVLSCVERNCLRFINRAFSNPDIHSHITPLLKFFSDTRRHGTAPRVFVHLRKESLDIAAIASAEIKIANTFRYRTVEDAVYYILAVRRALGSDSGQDEVMVCGESAAKRSLLPRLREFVPTVIPMIFPAEIFRAGREALNAPFDQIILPTCE